LDVAQAAPIEALYAERGLQAAFRVADVVGHSNMHTELRRKGYQAEQPHLYK